jgi:major membrane immunogen (membrane-anchored lipoprotein)
MKKLIAFFFVAVLALSLAACKEREYPVDGVFLGYEVGVSRNAPMVTFVTITVEDGEIVEYDIDVRQGSRTGDGSEATPYAWAWNASTKKELGFAYHMHYGTSGATTEAEYQAWLTANNKLEWFQQAELIEAYWLENAVETLGGDPETAIDNVTGVTIKNAYEVAATRALENAKAGKFQAIYCSGSDLYIAEMTLTSKGAIDTLVIDTLQANKDAATGSFAWKTQTKQELGYAYGMHKRTSGTTTEAEYIAWLEANNKLEWFEQADLIAADIIANGWSTNAAENVPAGVTITTTGYYTVLAKLFDLAGNSVK